MLNMLWDILKKEGRFLQPVVGCPRCADLKIGARMLIVDHPTIRAISFYKVQLRDLGRLFDLIGLNCLVGLE